MNNPGGLKNRKVKPKWVVHHANSQQPERYCVELFKKYLSHRPARTCTNAFYPTPISNCMHEVWYKNVPIREHTLGNTEDVPYIWLEN